MDSNKIILAKIKGAVALCLLLLLICFVSVAKADTIKDFKSNIKIETNSVIDVTEQITMRIDDFGKHGTIRQIPNRKKDSENRVFESKFSVYDCKINGRSAQFVAEVQGDHISIRIGDGAVILEPGLYTFTIAYKATRQIGFFDKYDELYWNVTGDMWNMPIEKASCTVELPAGNKKFRSLEWYRGARGESGYMQNGQRLANTVCTTKGLNAREGLTVCYTFDKGLVTEPAPYFGAMKTIENIALAVAILSFVLFAFLIFHAITHKKQEVVIPIWDIPREITPSISRYVNFAKCGQTALSADIIFLATKGYIKIKENEEKSGFSIFTTTKRNLSLECIKPLDEVMNDPELSEDLRDIMKELFADDNTISLTDENGETFVNLLENVQFHAQTFLHGKTISKAFYPALQLGLFAIGFLALLPFWGEDMTAFGAVALACLVPCVIGYSALSSLCIVPRAKKKGAFFVFVALVFIYGMALMIFSAFVSEFQVYAKTLFALMLSSLPIIFSALLARDYNSRGLADFAKVKGIELFLDMAEKERIKFFESYDKDFASPKAQYERFLPYAVALGVAKTWGEKFATCLKEISYVPTWYETNSFDLFDIMLLNSRLNMMSHIMGTNIESFKSSQQSFTISGGGSGFGGGGFSGGGGGGGGGSTW